MTHDLPIGRSYARWLMAILAWGVVAFGAVYPWAYAPLAIGAAALGLWGWLATRARPDRRTRVLAAALAVIGLAIGVQLVVLPYHWVEVMSPGVDAYFRQFRLAYQPGSEQTLSIAARETVVVLLLYGALAMFLVGLSRAIRYVDWHWLVNQLIGLGVALALFGAVQKALGNPEHPLVYGFWQPAQGGNPFGPFINRNHFAGWMVMVLPIVLGYAWSIFHDLRPPTSAARRSTLGWVFTVEANRLALVTFAVVVMAMSIALTGSRSGVTSLAIAIVALAVFMVGETSGGRRRIQVGAVLALVVVAAVGWAGAGPVAQRFSQASAERGGRLDAWRDTAHIIHDFPLFGTGLGTYADAMLLYQTSDRSWMYAEAHNDYLQLAAEGGVLIGFPVLVAVGVIGWTIRRRLTSREDDPTTRWVRIGSVAGLVGIAAQSVVEFSLQMPGNAAWCVLLLAIALHRPSRRLRAHRV